LSPTATFRFHGDLEPLLAREQRGAAFSYPVARAATLKNAIEALGVPHTEVGRLLVNGMAATLDRAVRQGDAIEVLPWPDDGTAAPIGERRFVADAHLGALARYLRMLGFDTAHANDLGDAAIQRLARGELRVVLTRDRELLKCRDIHFGCLVRALRPDEQLRAVAARYGLAARAEPFSRCLCCNLPLDQVSKAEIADRLPEQVRAHQERFMACHGCRRIYWPGSHYARMREALRGLLPDAGAESSSR
jgi:uncharacterized protein